MIGPRAALIVSALIVLGVAIAIPVGRHERMHARAAQEQKLTGIYALVGSVTSPRFSALRLSSNFDCLLYKFGLNPYAVELCFDPQGRLIEAIDRRDELAIHVASFRTDQGATPVQVSPHTIVGFLHHYVYDNNTRLPIGASLPTGANDGGPQLVVRKKNAGA